MNMKPIASFDLLVGNDSIEVLLASPNCNLDFSAIIGESLALGLIPASKEIVQKFLEQHMPVVQGLTQDIHVETIVALGSLHDSGFGRYEMFPVVRMPSYDRTDPEWKKDDWYLSEQPIQARKGSCDLVLLVRPANHGSEVITS
jgi:hypothetical protein